MAQNYRSKQENEGKNRQNNPKKIKKKKTNDITKTSRITKGLTQEAKLSHSLLATNLKEERNEGKNKPNNL